MSARDRMRALAALPWRTLAALGPAGRHARVSFVVERRDWSIRWDGIQICSRVNELEPGLAGLTTRPERITGGVAHFGSQFMWEVWHRHLSKRIPVAVSYFHGKPEDGPDMARHVAAFRENLDRIDRVVVANTEVEARVRSWGIREDRLVRIPIGVDTSLFCVPTAEARAQARERYGIPAGRLAIGSFQKDGVGWGDGMEPKLVKGPDLFVDAVSELAKSYPVFVLLTGPARGYVVHRLEALGIPYAHHYLDDYREIVSAYHALDLYLMTSREEGGPKSILECAATGVPIVSSRVGMAPDVIEDGGTGFLVNAGDTGATVRHAASLLGNDALRSQIALAARNGIEAYDWSRIGEAHLRKVYRPMIEST